MSPQPAAVEAAAAEVAEAEAATERATGFVEALTRNMLRHMLFTEGSLAPPPHTKAQGRANDDRGRDGAGGLIGVIGIEDDDDRMRPGRQRV